MTASSGHQAKLNGDGYSTYDTGMCLKWVRGPCWDVPSLYGSAIDAWNGSRDKHPGDRNPPEGAPCFYSGGTYGHIVIAQGGGPRMRSTDCTSSYDVSDADISWIEQHWSGRKYLGWCGDLNGVDLPLAGGGDDDMNLQDEIAEWSPDEGTSKDDTTVGKTLNQARGYAEDAYDRVKSLQTRVDKMDDKLDKILDALG